jgi:hypothetical protein
MKGGKQKEGKRVQEAFVDCKLLGCPWPDLKSFCLCFSVSQVWSRQADGRARLSAMHAEAVSSGL